MLDSMMLSLFFYTIIVVVLLGARSKTTRKLTAHVLARDVGWLVVQRTSRPRHLTCRVV